MFVFELFGLLIETMGFFGFMGACVAVGLFGGVCTHL